MALVLTVNSDTWNQQVESLTSTVSGLIPVVKGNGYGFGRDWLAERAARIASTLAVGTVFEVGSIPTAATPMVLTPTLEVPYDLRADAILTVGSLAHITAASGKPRNVVVKIRSSMNRYGASIGDVPELINQCRANNLHVRGVSIHPPLVGTSNEHRLEIENLLSTIDPSLPAWVSHIEPHDFADLQSRYPERQWYLRLGTSLWHGDKSAFNLTADVLETLPATTGQKVGYRGAEITENGTVIMVGCGSSHGVAPLTDNASPFHFARQRMQLVEAPHMHTSMCFIPSGQPTPNIGDHIDVQRPLITAVVDRIDWA